MLGAGDVIQHAAARAQRPRRAGQQWGTSCSTTGGSWDRNFSLPQDIGKLDSSLPDRGLCMGQLASLPRAQLPAAVAFCHSLTCGGTVRAHFQLLDAALVLERLESFRANQMRLSVPHLLCNWPCHANVMRQQRCAYLTTTRPGLPPNWRCAYLRLQLDLEPLAALRLGILLGLRKKRTNSLHSSKHKFPILKTLATS